VGATRGGPRRAMLRCTPPSTLDGPSPTLRRSGMQDITNHTSVELGIVPTHSGFVGALVPGEAGKLPRGADGRFVVLAAVSELAARSRVRLESLQLSVFPGTDDGDLDELIVGLKDLGLRLYLVLMVGGVDPMEPADESAVVDQLLPSLEAAKRHGGAFVSSTSIEAWMAEGAVRREGAAFEAAVAQCVKVHLRACREASLAGSQINEWHFEFLRPGEFQTFTDLGRVWTLIKAANEEMGAPFFKAIIDAAHCGDSPLDIPENLDLITRIGAAGELGCFHASARTTRGCLSTDDGWAGALLTAAARTGTLRNVFVEMFRHDDEALAALRALDPGHGVDTRDGRDYTQLVADGLTDTARRLNNLKARGILQPTSPSRSSPMI